MSEQNDFTPSWVKGLLWYQIFPDRFFRGDKRNDPTRDYIKNSWPFDAKSEWQIHPWISDWYELQPYEKKNGEDIWYNIQRRRYGGDLKGIIQKLDYLDDLGVGGIYLNPVFTSPSAHKYDQVNYHHVDPHLGPNPGKDKILIANEDIKEPSTWIWTDADLLLLELIKQVHKRGMYIILDAVFNHMSPLSIPFSDVQKNQQNSEFRDWFKIKTWDNPETGEKFSYECWGGFPNLAELSQNENGITEGPKEYIFNSVKRWMAPVVDGDEREGIDGWRLDAAYFVKHPFWKEFRKFTKDINPDCFILGELTTDFENTKPYLQGDEFDAVTNYNFAFPCSEYFIDKKKGISTAEFNNELKLLRTDIQDCVTLSMANLYTSHDTCRLLSHIFNPALGNYRNFDEYISKYSKAGSPSFKTGKPGKREIRTMELMILFQMTYPGSPMIYYGDEAGMWGAGDPCSRKPMIWPELNYDNENTNHDGTLKKRAETVEFNNKLYDYYRNLIYLRKKHASLRMGDYKTLLADSKNNLLIFERFTENERLVIVINNSNHDKSYSFEKRSAYNTCQELFSGEVLKFRSRIFTHNIEPKHGHILLFKQAEEK